MSHQGLAIAVLSLFWPMLCVSCCGCRSRENRGTGRRAATCASAKDETVALLKQALEDSLAWDKRLQGQSDRRLFGWARTARTLYAKYPVVYAKERLIARGSVAVPILLEITRDQRQADVRFVAWDVLGELSPSLCLDEVFKAGKEGRISAGQVSSSVLYLLPVRVSADYWQQGKVMDWLGTQLARRSFAQIALELMDEFLRAEYEDGGMHPGVVDDRVLRWLNRVYDVDLDTWLAAKAPAVLRFRNEQLSRGYDPATAFGLGNNIANGLLDEAMAAIYSEAKDQRACKELLEATNPDLLPGGVRSPLHPQASPGWEQRLKDWYWAERPFLQYDPSLRRFVSKRQAGGDPTSRASPVCSD